MRGAALSQLGELASAKVQLRAALRGLGPKDGLLRARCLAAKAEIALALGDHARQSPHHVVPRGLRARPLGSRRDRRRRVDPATGRVLKTLEMPAGVSGLEAKGDLFFGGGGKTAVVRAVKRSPAQIGIGVRMRAESPAARAQLAGRLGQADPGARGARVDQHPALLCNIERSVTVEHVRRALPLYLAVAWSPLLAGCSAGGAPGESVGTLQQANTCATGTTLEGVDVSVYDGMVDWTQVKASGRAFAIAKASEGSTFTDSQFSTNWPAMKSAGIVRSAYHFFHCDTDPTTQATFFLSVMGSLEPGDLPPSLDFEDTTTCTSTTGVAMAIQWLDTVASATGTLPILYTSVNVLSNFTNTESLAGHAQLWVASRGVTCPDLPTPFTAWSFWQYSLTGTAPGLPNSNGMADLDQFNGDMSGLLGLTVGGSVADASSSSDSGPPACTAGGVAGTCIDTAVCAAMPGYVATPDLCPGPASEQCCTPQGDAATGEAGDAGISPRGDGGGARDASTSPHRDGGGAGDADGGGGANADRGPNASSGSCGCSTALGGRATSTSMLPAALLLVCGAALSRRPRCRRRHRRERDGASPATSAG